MHDNSDQDGPSASESEVAAAFYRLKADVCQQMAAATSDPELRDQWIQLANQWTYLVLHAHERIEPRNRALG